MSIDNTELRYNILTQSKDMLYTQWQGQVEVERASASFQQRTPSMTPPPSVEDIVNLSDALFAWVTK